MSEEKYDVILLPENSEMLEYMPNIDIRKFQEKKDALKEFSEKIPEKASLPTVEESGGLFGWFDHWVTGEELNRVTDKIQSYMINQNKHIVETIQQFNTVYETFETLDNEYIRKITNALGSAGEANRKAMKSIEGLENAQCEINTIINTQQQLLAVLKRFKDEIEKIKHIADVDKLFEDLIILKNNAEQLNELLKIKSTEIAHLEKEIIRLSDVDEQNVSAIKVLEQNSNNSFEALNERIDGQDKLIQILKNELAEEKSKNEALKAYSEKTFKMLKIFGGIAGAGAAVILILVLLIIGGVL